MNHVIIFGCGRSGTSILGELFEEMDEYSYLFEADVLDIENFEFNGPKLLASKVPKIRARNFTLYIKPLLRNLLAPKKVHKALSPGLTVNLEWLIKTLPCNYKFIFIARHPLDTICSLKPGIEAGWSHNPRPLDYKKYLKAPLVERCARHWQYINDVGFKTLTERNEVLIVLYENLVLNTRDTVQRILNYIEMTDYSISKLASYIEKVQDKTKDSYQAKKQIRWYRDDHITRINRWKNDLTKDEAESAWKIVGSTAKQFGYKLDLVVGEG